MKLKIGFIGSGNVATHLSHAMNTIGHDIVQIISKNVELNKKNTILNEKNKYY